MRRTVVAGRPGSVRRKHFCGRNRVCRSGGRTVAVSSPLTKTQVHQAGHDIENGDRAEQCAGRETRGMRVLPDSEVAQREIDGERRRGDKKPFARGRFSLSKGANNWIQDGSNGEAGIDTGAACANRKLMSEDEK